MTRLVTFTLLSAFAFAAQAQNPDDMGNMMQGVQEMMACMANIDQAELERLGKEGEQMHAEMKALCAEGKRDEAQARAMEYGMKVAQDPTLQAMAECGKQAQGMMPQMQPSTSTPTPEELQNQHICDME